MEKNTKSDLQAKLDIAAEALRRSEERAIAGQLALELMHELRNPLEALGHLNYLAAAEADQTDKVRQYMRLAAEQMAMLSQIVNETLGFARSADFRRSIDLVSLAEAALRIHQRSIDEKKIHLIKHLPDGVVSGPVHGGQILQVVSNLINNAVDALPHDGTLTVRIRKCNGEVHVLVADNGHGIAPEHVASIFEPFFTTKQERGTGLGLALSRKILDHHRGRIKLRSSIHPDRHGTAFKISLPA